MSKSTDFLKKLQRSGYDLMSDSSIINEKELLRMKVPILNLAFSGMFDGGMEVGTTILAGPSSTFKTGLLLYMAKTFQSKFPDGVFIFIDSEGGTNPQMLKNFGIDINRVIYVDVTNIGEMHTKLQNLLQKQITPDVDVFLAVDSIGNVATLGEVERALSDKISADVGNRAKELKSVFRTISPFIRKNGVYTVFLNHTYDTPEMFSKRIMSGGSGPMYDAQTVIFLSKVNLPKELKINEGDNRFNIFVQKSRRVSDRSKFFIDVYQGKGIDPLSNLLDIAKDKDCGVLKHYHGAYWDYMELDETTGEVTETRVNSSEFKTAKFWAKVLKNKLLLDYVDGKYLISIDNSVMTLEDDIFDLMEKYDEGEINEEVLEQDNKKGNKKEK